METHQIPKVPGGEFRYQRRYTKSGVHPYDAVTWETRDAVITDAKGQVIFEQKSVEAPSLWSQTATNIVASKYFRGRLGTRERESSVRQLLDRVAKTITKWGVKGQYFLDEDEAQVFEAELLTFFSTRWPRSTAQSGSTSGSRIVPSAQHVSSTRSRMTCDR